MKVHDRFGVSARRGLADSVRRSSFGHGVRRVREACRGTAVKGCSSGTGRIHESPAIEVVASRPGQQPLSSQTSAKTSREDSLRISLWGQRVAKVPRTELRMSYARLVAHEVLPSGASARSPCCRVLRCLPSAPASWLDTLSRTASLGAIDRLHRPYDLSRISTAIPEKARPPGGSRIPALTDIMCYSRTLFDF